MVTTRLLLIPMLSATLAACGPLAPQGQTGSGDAAEIWTALGGGEDQRIAALAIGPDGTLYAGGIFATVGGQPMSYVARWDGEAWDPLGGRVLGDVTALAVGRDGVVYAAGTFSEAGGVAVNRIARWDGQAWSGLHSGVEHGRPGRDGGRINALALGLDNSLYAAGEFTAAGGQAASNVARWDGQRWSALGAGLDDWARSLATGPDGSLYAGGAFQEAGGRPASRIARWDGQSWSGLGSGVDAQVEGIAVAADGVVYAAGLFTEAGGKPALGVARWDGESWLPLGSGIGNWVSDLVLGPDGVLYAGGGFTEAGGREAYNVARWDGQEWSSIGTGLDDFVSALAVSAEGELYAGGEFAEAGVARASLRVLAAAAAPVSSGTGTAAPSAAQPDAQLAAAGPDQPIVCPTERCFEDGFRACERGTRFTTPEALGARARYDILGRVEGGCRISLTYVSNPNPDWVDRPLLLTLDHARPFLDQVMQAMTACTTGRESRFQCGGPLQELLR
jgi:hypothetical protein